MRDLERIAKKEHSLAIVEAIKKGLKKDGLFVFEFLKKRGWNNISYSKKKHSKFYVWCGHSGCFQQSKLVKEEEEL